MFNYISKRYEEKKDKLYSSYNITLFSKLKDREVFLVFVVVLGLKIEIEANETMVRMTYDITEAHICYDFSTFLVDEIKTNLARVDQGDF